jgi:DNA-binding response OmpR family regulator
MARVLIIDDDVRYANLVQHALEFNGYEVASLTRLGGALVKMISFRPDVVLLDVIMPECSGPELLRRLGTSWRNAGVRFVLHSNLPDAELAPIAEACGADGYLHKRGVQNLLEKLESLLAAPTPAGTILHADRAAQDPGLRRSS